jgi:serine/threonine-protein kinase
LRLHAKGGLGQVSVALDTELDRPVALKEIQEQHADDQNSRARFTQEAEITGKLEHPGIVPVYGLGHYADGRPFYAMRFVQGDSLKEAIARFHAGRSQVRDHDSRTLQLRDLLRRFTDVCNAVAYAHSRGVLHRDLKPGNVMLGPFGETLVVDWGLAKPMGESVASMARSQEAAEYDYIRLSGLSGTRDATLPGRPVGTPAFMSPEQAQGQFERLGPRSDVYGLGATLYCSLTGRAPVEGDDLGAILRAVQLGAFPPPRTLDASIDPALEAVCLKAMALRPEDRYPSPRELARDVERWLADEPVSAYREPLANRARRWSRRHRTLVTSATAVLMLGVLTSVAFASVVTGKNRELARQMQRAEAREKMAIEAVQRFHDVVVKEPVLKNNLAFEPLRKNLLRKPLEFFNRLRGQLQADGDTRPEALARLAEAAYELAFLTEEIGNEKDALRSYQESLVIFERLARNSPAVAEFSRGLAKSLSNIGIIHRATGHPDQALDSIGKALAVWERLASENATVNDFQRDLANSYHNLGYLKSDLGN